MKLAAFRDAYGLDASVAIVGGYDGRLNDDGERIRLLRPDAAVLDNGMLIVPRLLEDEVEYGDLPPWPTEPDGQGASLWLAGHGGLKTLQRS